MGRYPRLIAGGVLSAAAAALHLGAIIGGAEWYRFFGAGEGIAGAAERGSIVAALMALGIATILAVWAAYAFAGAGLIPRPPLIRTGLVLITAVYLVRGLSLLPLWVLKPQLVGPFEVWSSLIVLVYGATYAIGTWRAGPSLSRR